MRERTPKILLCIMLASIVFAAAYTRGKLNAISAAHPVPDVMAFLPSSDRAKPFFIGFHREYAVLLWIRTTIYFGSHIMGDGNFPWLVSMIDIITRLNPEFYPAYEFGGLMLPKFCNNPDAARIILERGIASKVEKKWKLYFYLGMLYYEKYKDNVSATICIVTASGLDGAPEKKLSALARALYMKTSDTEKNGRFLDLLYGASENPEVRKHVFAASGRTDRY
jgi:hypothetical protein